MSIVALLIAIAIASFAFVSQREQVLNLRREVATIRHQRDRQFADLLAARSAAWSAQTALVDSVRESDDLRERCDEMSATLHTIASLVRSTRSQDAWDSLVSERELQDMLAEISKA